MNQIPEVRISKINSPHDKNLRVKSNNSGKIAQNIHQSSSTFFFNYNMSLGPPYQILLDTNFINISIKNKIDIMKAMVSCLNARCIPCITDCVMAELEKLGRKYRIAHKIAQDERFERIHCAHTGSYADDCFCNRVFQHRCYIVATCDQNLKRRLRKIAGVPIMFFKSHKCVVEGLPVSAM